MPSRVFVVISALLGLLACSSKNRLPAPGVDSGQPAPKATVPPDTSPVDTGEMPETPLTEIIVGSERGLEAWRLDGTGKRVISRGKALHPRWLDETSVVVIVPNDSDLAKGGRIDRISIVDGKRSKVAKLPPFACKPSPGAEADDVASGLGLDLQDPGDFKIDRKKQQACISLMDRNINMVSVWVDILVDLTSGKVSRWLNMGEDSCLPPAGVKLAKNSEHLDCPFSVGTTKDCADPPTFPFSFSDDGMVKEGSAKGGMPVLAIPGYTPDPSEPSPSLQGRG